jgi:hypothetical protein
MLYKLIKLMNHSQSPFGLTEKQVSASVFHLDPSFGMAAETIAHTAINLQKT